MYKIKFPFYESCHEGVIIGTSRPETLFGDIAVAIGSGYHIGEAGSLQRPKSIFHPILRKEIPLILDDEMITPGMGTGAVKVFLNPPL